MAEVVLTYENIDITMADMESLKSFQFINDKIINFYLKYLHRTLLNREQQQKVHIFDSFFSEALDQMDDNRVVRWLRRVDVFDKDYILVPAIIDQHWFLVVICFPNNLDKNNVPLHKRPRIITMDSMQSHTMDKKPQLIRYLYGFIRKACVFQRNMSAQDIRDLSIKMKYIEYDVPEQVICFGVFWCVSFFFFVAYCQT